MKKVPIIALTSLALVPLVANAEVTSMSLERFKQNDKEKYWEVSLKCNNDPQARLMKRIIGKGNQWCSTEQNGPCDSSKFVLSRKICGVEEPKEGEKVVKAAETSQIENTQQATPAPAAASKAIAPAEANAAEAQAAIDAATQARKTELLKEQVMIEEQRILIEQKRLQLKAREIELLKQKASN